MLMVFRNYIIPIRTLSSLQTNKAQFIPRHNRAGVASIIAGGTYRARPRQSGDAATAWDAS